MHPLLSHVCMWHIQIRTWSTSELRPSLHTHKFMKCLIIFLQHDGVSNEPETFSCHMQKHELPFTHTKDSQIVRQTRFLENSTYQVDWSFKNELRWESGKNSPQVAQEHHSTLIRLLKDYFSSDTGQPRNNIPLCSIMLRQKAKIIPAGSPLLVLHHQCRLCLHRQLVTRRSWNAVWMLCPTASSSSTMAERDSRTLSCRFCSLSKSAERDSGPLFLACSSRRETRLTEFPTQSRVLVVKLPPQSGGLVGKGS